MLRAPNRQSFRGTGLGVCYHTVLKTPIYFSSIYFVIDALITFVDFENFECILFLGP